MKKCLEETASGYFWQLRKINDLAAVGRRCYNYICLVKEKFCKITC